MSLTDCGLTPPGRSGSGLRVPRGGGGASARGVVRRGRAFRPAVRVRSWAADRGRERQAFPSAVAAPLRSPPHPPQRRP